MGRTEERVDSIVSQIRAFTGSGILVGTRREAFCELFDEFTGLVGQEEAAKYREKNLTPHLRDVLATTSAVA
jgi:hypothetical protein